MLNHAVRNPSWVLFSDYLKNRFGEKIHKITLDAGATCPTRDGGKGFGGCAFCDVWGSSSFHTKREDPKQDTTAIHTQMATQIPRIQERFRVQKVLAYFQSYTATYQMPNLEAQCAAAGAHPDVAGIAIGTRPDCVPNEVLESLARISEEKPLFLELGVQSFCDKTLEWLDRGHSVAESIDAIHRIAQYVPKATISLHLMWGAPTDRMDEALQSAYQINQLPVHGAKLHQLMVLKKTKLSSRFAVDPWPVQTREEYGESVREFLMHLDKSRSIFIERFFAQPSHPEDCEAPAWSLERWANHNYFFRLGSDL